MQQQSFVAPSDVAIPADWKDVRSPKDLRIQSWFWFHGTWGHFDVKEAYESWRRDAPPLAQIPSVQDLRAHGYFLRFFRGCMDLKLERDRLIDILQQPDTALAQYLVQHHVFWQKPENANRIDEIQKHFEGMTPDNFRREARPPALLARLAREHAASRTEQLSDVPFPGLKLIDPCVYEEGDFTVEVITTSRQLSRASCELNCAGGYVRVARAGHTVLLVLKQAGKLVGMAEWINAEAKFMQLVEHCNEPIRDEWREIFDRAEKYMPKQLVIASSDSSDQQLTPPFYLPPSCLEILNIQLRKVATPIKLQLENIVNMSPQQSHQMVTPALLALAGLGEALSRYDWQTLRTAESLIELACLNGDKKLFGQLLEIWCSFSWWSWAIDRGSLQTMKALARLGVISMEREGPEMLHKAVRGNHIEIARWLIEAGANVNAKLNNFHKTPLLMAAHLRQMTLDSLQCTGDNQERKRVAAQRSLQMLQCLIDAGADMNAENHGGRTALHEALLQRDYEVANILIDSGADVNLMCEGLPPLHRALSNFWGQEDDTTGQIIEIAEKLIAFGANVNAVNHDGNMPLHLAVKKHMPVRMLQSLIKAGADLNAKDILGKTPLHLASAHRIGEDSSFRLSQCLIEAGADVNVEDHGGRTALHEALLQRDYEVANILIDSGADVNLMGEGLPPLHIALSNFWGQEVDMIIEIAEKLIAFGANVNAVGRNGDMPLHLAVKKHMPLRMLQSLIKAGADVTAVNRSGNTPFYIALCVYLPTVDLDFLIQSGADATEVNAVAEDGKTQLHAAATRCNLDFAKWLIELRADVNAVDTAGNTPLHFIYCPSFCHALKFKGAGFEFANLLIASGADANAVNKRGESPLYNILRCTEDWDGDSVKRFFRSVDLNAVDKDGRSPLHMVAHKPRIARVLVQAGADVNAVDKDGRTPLHEAADEHSLEYAKLLIESDADVNAVDMQGKNPLHQGAYYCRVEMSKFLIQCGADIGAMDKDGKTPLHTAVAERTLSYDYSTDKAEMVKLLLNFGADPNAVDNDGKTPYDMAALHSDTGVALLLEEAADNACKDQD